jgi:hypothetical protein
MIPCVGGASFARVEFGGCQLQSGEARGAPFISCNAFYAISVCNAVAQHHRGRSVAQAREVALAS